MSKFRVQPNIAYLETVFYLAVAKIEADSQKGQKHIWCLPHASLDPRLLKSLDFACSDLAVSSPLISNHLGQRQYPTHWSSSSRCPSCG